jgi:hypothetical protein
MNTIEFHEDGSMMALPAGADGAAVALGGRVRFELPS